MYIDAKPRLQTSWCCGMYAGSVLCALRPVERVCGSTIIPGWGGFHENNMGNDRSREGSNVEVVMAVGRGTVQARCTVS